MSRLMQHLHRAIVVLLLCASLLGSLGIACATLHDLATRQALTGSHGLVSQGIAWFSAETQFILHAHVYALVGVLALVALASAGLLWAEVGSLLTRSPRLVLSRGELGEVAISMDQVGLLAQREAEHVAGVREVRTFAASNKGGLQVQQTIAVEPNLQLPALAEEIQSRVKKSLEYHLGFPVSGVQVALQRASISRALL